ncbi:MAG: hypothetical protein MJ248_02265 [Bacilli bacterium]|nr:hypothetical protein [Bacilli bacterium]
MEVKWFNAKDKEGVASFYLTNIDLNIVASVPFQYAYRVQVGVDGKGNIIIKPYNKARVDSGELDEYALYKLSINKSYTRISSTDLMKNISGCLGISLDKKVPVKFNTRWDDNENVLIVLTGKEN